MFCKQPGRLMDCTTGRLTTSYGIISNGFSSQVYREFYLNDFYDKDDIRDAINDITQRQGFSTNTGLAIWHMRRRMFTKRRGAREGVSKVDIHCVHPEYKYLSFVVIHV